MAANKSAEILRCEKCGREVLVIRPAEGQLKCCGQPMKIPVEIFTVDTKFVQVWTDRYDKEFKGGEDITGEKADLDWMFKEKASAQTTLQKAGLWDREIGDSSDEAWLEYVKIIRELSANLNVTRRELGKALFAYEKLGTKDIRCPYCNGTGNVDGPGKDLIVTCPACKGRRYNFISEGSKLCTNCHGTGKFISGSDIEYTKKLCPECKGTGWVQAD